MTHRESPGSYAPPPPVQQAGPWPGPLSQLAAPRQRRRFRVLFWIFVLVQLFFLLSLLGAGAQQTTETTFDTLGSAAAVDVILVAGAWLWRLGGR